MSVLKVYNPFDLELVGELPYTREDEIEKMLATGHEISENPDLWLPKSERLRVLSELRAKLLAARPKLIEQALREGGKPRVDTAVEIDRGLGGIDIAIEALSRQAGCEVPMNLGASSQARMAYTYYRPRGLTVGISAFNHPFNLIIHQVIPAVAAGSPVIIKPALTTPLSCSSIIDTLRECGLPREYAQMAIVDDELAEKIVCDPRQRFLTFIGSSRVGWHLRSKLPAGAECMLEHGGAAPVIVEQTADLDALIPSLVKGAYYHGGQVCVSVQRIYVHETIKSEFTERYKAAVERLKVGNQGDDDTDVGPLISPSQVERVATWVDEAVRAGANLVTGGQRLSQTTYAPSILTDVPPETRVAREEVFGPVAIVSGFSHLDEAISRANSLPFAFQASIFTDKLQSALRASRRLEGLAVMVNDHTAFRVDWMPFGGYKLSGMGSGGISQTIQRMSLEKMVVFRSEELI